MSTRSRRPASGAALLSLGAVAAALGGGCGGEGALAERPNIVLVTLDTTRADRLGCYGYERDTSPNLDRLAARSTLHARAYAVSSWTLPTHASLFTGKLPTSHGAGYDEQGRLQVVAGPRYPNRESIRVRPLGQEEVTLAELLRAEGYATGAVLAGPWMKRIFGLDQGFDHYDDERIPVTVGRRAAGVTKAGLQWVADQGEGPFFLFLNYYDPHDPYLAPPAFRDHFLPDGTAHEDLSQKDLFDAMYDAEVRYLDHHLGLLFDGLAERGLLDGAWVIITADHGELLGENDEWGHGNSLSTAELHIPLLSKLPGSASAPTRDERPIQQTDVLPMIAARLGLSLPPAIQGASVRDAHPIVAEVNCFPTELCRGDWRAIVDGGFKYARCTNGEEVLVDAVRDPGESVDLMAKEPERARELEAALSRYLEGLPRPAAPAGPEQEVDEETRQALENLGYVGGGPRGE